MQDNRARVQEYPDDDLFNFNDDDQIQVDTTIVANGTTTDNNAMDIEADDGLALEVKRSVILTYFGVWLFLWSRFLHWIKTID